MNFKPQIQTLSHGMRLVTLSMPQLQSVTVLLMVKVGSRYEPNNIAGISHFLEHMVFKGTKKYPTAFELTSTVDSIGAQFNAFTSKEYTGFYVKSAANHLNLALDVLSQLVWHPLLPTKEMEKEKGVIIEEINMYEDNPMLKAGEEFESLIYPSSGPEQASPLGRETIGYKKTVQAMARKDFVDFRKQWYRPERMVLGIVGGTNKVKSPKLVKSLIREYFGQSVITDTRSRADYNTTSLKSLKFVQQKPKLKVKFKKTKQTHLCLGVRAFPHAHKDRYVMAVLATILGGNMSSRLFTEVREKRGLAYYIKSNINTYFDNGYLVSQAGADIKKTKEAIKVILEEYNRVKSQKSKVKSKELKKAKEYLKGRMALNLEDSKGVASLFVEDLILEDKIRTPKQIVQGVEKVTLADLQRVSQKIFVNQGLNLAIIGPYKDEGRFEKILKL